MPVIVLRNNNSKVGPWVVDAPEGADPQLIADAWAAEGWSLDKKTDPVDVPPNLEPAEPVNPEGN